MKNLFNLDEMAEVLKALDEANKDADISADDVMTEEMKASEKRVQEILEKHTEK